MTRGNTCKILTRNMRAYFSENVQLGIKEECSSIFNLYIFLPERNDTRMAGMNNIYYFSFIYD